MPMLVSQAAASQAASPFPQSASLFPLQTRAPQYSESAEAAPLSELGLGFSGAPVVELEQLHLYGGPGDVVFFGVDCELNRRFGDHNPGAATFLRQNTACMAPWTSRQGAPCQDIGVITATDPDIAMRDAVALAGYIASLGRRPVLIGCDHTASLAGISGLLNTTKLEPVYIYLDAHYDLGRHGEPAPLGNGNFVDMLLQSARIARVVNIGGRSWATFNPVYHHVAYFQAVPQTQAAVVIDALSWLRGHTVYVSIDADVLDPTAAPNVCCPEPFGMSPTDLLAICEWLGRSCDVRGADVCELMPAAQNMRSEQVLMRCVHALFPGGR
jgi:arginase family enzyme